MAEVTIYGFPQSTYVRTCCMTCIEKGVGYDHEPVPPHSPEILALSPTGTVPAFRHGDLVLFESNAIARYIDERFEGPALQPSDVVARAGMNQWLGMIGDSVYRVMIREIVLPRFGILEADETKLAEAAEKLARQLTFVDRALENHAYLVGDRLTLADLFLPPILFWLEKTPEGQAALPQHAALGRWYEAIGARASFQDTVPPMPG